MGGNGRRDQQTTARQTSSSSGGRQSGHVRKTPPPDGLVPPLSADEHQDATDVCAHTDNLGCGLFWHVSYAASLRGAQFCRFIFFPFLFMNDEAECRRHSILLRICSPSTLQTFQKRECLSLSIYIYIFIFIYTQVKCTLQGNKLLWEKQTQRLNGRRLLPQTGESWTVTRLESACISCKYHILHNSEVGYILTKYNHRWLHLPGGVLHSTCSLFSESKQSQVELCCRRLLVLVSLRLHEWIQTFRLFGPWKKTETQFSLLFFFDAVVSFSSTKQVIWEQNPPQTAALPGWKHSDWIPNVHPLDFQTAPWWSSDVRTVTCSLSRMSSLQGCETAGI